MAISVSIGGNTGASGTATTIAIASVVYATGDRLLVAIRWRSTSVTISSVSDGVHTFNQVGSTYTDADDRCAWYEAIGTASGTRTITVTFSSTVTFRYAAAINVSGSDSSASQAIVLTSNKVGDWSTATDNMTSGTLTPTGQPNAVIGLGSTIYNARAIAAGTGYTSLGALANWDLANGDTSRAEWKRTTSTSSSPVTFTLSGGTDGGFIFAIVVGEAPSVTVTSVTPSTFANSDTGIVVAGTVFEASQGAGKVTISPTDSIGGEATISPTFVSNVDGGANPTTTTTITIPTVVTDQVMIVAFTSRDHTSGTAQPTVTDNNSGSWTQKDFSTDRIAQLWWRRVISGDTAKTITIAGAVGSLSAVLHVIKDAYPTGDPITDLTQETNISGNETHAAITPTNAGSYLVGVVFNYANDNAVTSMSTATAGALANFNEHLSTGGNDCATAIAGLTGVAASSTGAFTWAQTNGTTYSMLFAVRARAALGAAVDQTVTSWADTSITITAVQSSLATGVGLYLFVQNNSAGVNASGYSVQFSAGGGSTVAINLMRTKQIGFRTQ